MNRRGFINAIIGTAAVTALPSEIWPFRKIFIPRPMGTLMNFHNCTFYDLSSAKMLPGFIEYLWVDRKVPDNSWGAGGGFEEAEIVRVNKESYFMRPLDKNFGPRRPMPMIVDVKEVTFDGASLGRPILREPIAEGCGSCITEYEKPLFKVAIR